MSVSQSIHFKWSKSTIGKKVFPKAAILIPLTINTKRHFLQLDTGCPRTYIYTSHFYNSRTRLKIKDKQPIELDILIGGKKFKQVFLADNQTKKHKSTEKIFSVGLLGNDFFKDKIFFIDFPKKEIKFSESSFSVPPKFIYLDSKFKKNFIYLTLKYENKKFKVIYDTGASIFPLATNKKRWLELTGKNGKEKDNKTLIVSAAFGKKIKLVGAPIKKELFLSGMNFLNKIVYYEPAQTPTTDFSLINCEGLMGNTIFLNKSIHIDFINKKFAVL